ncbi:unnamed protein product [Didymodactylos carnosus]|uniref:Histone-lysine N-methyltransferase n=1 Tax=Didymodactylos carnosus TaxID=1234261 RepID=A0A814LQG4_9BILA|nr:unnamed protein product [Didymodactylos carnosus]CAF3835659.1 unnamed protein product [Didymodactylos carnosus]
MNESISNKIDIKQENVCIGSSPGDLRIQSTSTSNRNQPMMRTSSVEGSSSMTILVQNPFDDTHHVSPSTALLHSPSNDTTSKFMINSPQISSGSSVPQSPSKQHSLTNLQSPRNIATPNQMGTSTHLISSNNNQDRLLDSPSPNRPQQAPSRNVATIIDSSPTAATAVSQANFQQQQRNTVQPMMQPRHPGPSNAATQMLAGTRTQQPHVQYNRDLLVNYGINVPLLRPPGNSSSFVTTNSDQTSSTSPPTASPLAAGQSTSTTSLIPLPNNIGINIPHTNPNQPSITPMLNLGQFSHPLVTSQTNFIPKENHLQLNTNHPQHSQSTNNTIELNRLFSQQQHSPNTQQARSTPSLANTSKTKRPPNSNNNNQVIQPQLASNQQQQQQMQYHLIKQQQQQQQHISYQQQRQSSQQLPPQYISTNDSSCTAYRTNMPSVSDGLIQTRQMPTMPVNPQQNQALQQALIATDDNILKSLLQINPQTNPDNPSCEMTTPLGKPMSGVVSTLIHQQSTNAEVISNGDLSSEQYDGTQQQFKGIDPSTQNLKDLFNSSSNTISSTHHMHHSPTNSVVIASNLQNHHQQQQSTSTIPQQQNAASSKVTKPRKKRKANELNASIDEDIGTTAKVRKRKKKSSEETEKFVKNSLQQLRDLPMLNPMEPSIDISKEPYSIIGLSDKQYNSEGDFGDVYIETIDDYYRPDPLSALSALERRYRVCSTLFDHPPKLPSPPLTLDSCEKVRELLLALSNTKKIKNTTNNDKNTTEQSSQSQTLTDTPCSPSPPESIVSASTLCDEELDDEAAMTDEKRLQQRLRVEAENIRLLKALTKCYSNELRSISPVLLPSDQPTIKTEQKEFDESTALAKLNNDNKTVATNSSGGSNSDANGRPILGGVDKVSVTLTLTTEASNDVQSVIAAVADLLKIAYPSSVDVRHPVSNYSSTKTAGLNSTSSIAHSNPATTLCNGDYNSLDCFTKGCICSTITTMNCTSTSVNNNNNIFNKSYTHPSRTVYKCGRETGVSIQSLIEMQPKYCRNCNIKLTTDNLFKKRLNELPASIKEYLPLSEPFVYFCNEQCYNLYLTNIHCPPPSSSLTINTQLPTSTATTFTSPQTLSMPLIKNEPMESPPLPSTSSGTSTAVDVVSPNGKKKATLKRRQESVSKPIEKRWKDLRWKRWDPSATLKTIIRLPNTNEIEQLICELKLTLTTNAKKDTRVCSFCNGSGDMETNGPGRLLNLDVGKWCHLNCALWSSEVYETMNGALMSVDLAYKRCLNIECASCKQKGASLMCFHPRCPNTYHFPCAVNNGCGFYKNKTIMCPLHTARTGTNDQILDDKSVFRKVWINRDEVKQIQSYMSQEHDETTYTLRIGSLVLHNVGQLLPHQLQSAAFHNRNFIYPVGYCITRFYWSMNRPNRRCAYICSIIDVNNRPMFRVKVREEEYPEEEFTELTAKAAWHKIVNSIDTLRRQNGLVKMFTMFVSGEDLYGLTEPHIIRLIESLPGVETLQNYAFKYGRLQLLDMPLTLNPTGCARSEPKLQTHFRRHALTLTSSNSTRSALPRTVLGIEDHPQIPYVKHFVLSKSTQYRKLKIEWRQNVFLAKSRIQGLGLFTARDLEKHTMVIEYIGELIRNEVANKREKLYEQQNRGIYMFRIDDEHVIDATMSGGLARYINHSCNPNCVAEVVQIEKDSKIIIITNRRITKGEELMYDYKFDFEDESSKIPCMCGASNCRKWMN